MTTPPPDKQPAAETLEEIADRLAKQITDNPCSHPSCCPRTAKVAADILSALRNERERAAKAANKQADSLRRAAHVVQQPTAEALRMAELAIVSVENVARAIRKG